MEESEIVNGLRRGEENALSAAIDLYGSYVAAIVCNITRGMLGTQDVEEAAADVFVSLWKNAGNLRDGSLRPYLGQAARNAARDRLRRFRSVLPLDENAPSREAPEEEAILREQREIVNGAVGGLGEPDREIFVRFYYFGERIRGIAARLGLNQATVKTKLRRARNKLRDKLIERGYDREKA